MQNLENIKYKINSGIFTNVKLLDVKLKHFSVEELLKFKKALYEMKPRYSEGKSLVCKICFAAKDIFNTKEVSESLEERLYPNNDNFSFFNVCIWNVFLKAKDLENSFDFDETFLCNNASGYGNHFTSLNMEERKRRLRQIYYWMQCIDKELKSREETKNND